MNDVDFSKSADGLVPAVIQDSQTRQVLMVGWMNAEALAETERLREVVFFSRSKGRLWKKGETSKNVLKVDSLTLDCDSDTLLIRATPMGPTCHTGNYSCFAEARKESFDFLSALEGVIDSRLSSAEESSYVASLSKKGIERIAQKVGEEGVEVALAGVGGDQRKVVSESADLIFHLMLLLRSKGCSLSDVVMELQGRHAQRNSSG